MKRIFMWVLVWLLGISTSVKAEFRPTLDQEYKIAVAVNKIRDYINEKNAFERQNELKKATSKASWMTQSRLKKMMYEQTYTNVREYAIAKVATLWWFAPMTYTWFTPRIYEDKYVRMLVYESADADEQWSYTLQWNEFWETWKHDWKSFFSPRIKYFDVQPDETIEQFIKKEVFWSKNPDNCHITQSNFWIFTSYHINSPLNTRDRNFKDKLCNGYITWWISFFTKLSPTLIIYANMWQDMPAFDLQTLEVK